MSNTATPRQHAYTSDSSPRMPEPSYAERVRTLVSLTTVGTLSTLSRKQEGFPFGSLMPFALQAGQPLFLISNMAMHTQNLKANPRASLFLLQPGAEEDPLGAARATLVGQAQQITGEEIAAVRDLYLRRQESSRYWVDFADFHFFRLDVIDVYYVGGFGVMGWVDAAEYRQAQPDPLATEGPGILRHMNADHVEAMILFAKHYAGLTSSEATMTSVDRLGFTLRVKTSDGMKAPRINFAREVSNAQQSRDAMVEMVREARKAEA